MGGLPGVTSEVCGNALCELCKLMVRKKCRNGAPEWLLGTPFGGWIRVR